MSALRNARSEFEKFSPCGAGALAAAAAAAAAFGSAGGVAGAVVVVVVVVVAVVAAAGSAAPGVAGFAAFAPPRARRGGMGEPAGAFGSKNPAGFGIVATSSRLRATWPASRKPGLSDARGSVDCGGAGAAAGRSCAVP